LSHYFKGQAQKQPTALGSLLQSSAYGSAIPVGYGMTQSVLLAIWAANLRQGGSIKKFKQFKKGITDYVEDIDFLLGHNPIRGVNQLMYNGGLIPLTFTSQSFSYDGSGSVEVTDDHFYGVIAVTCEKEYSFDVDDFGSTSGPQTLTGTFEVPLWNALENGPDPTDNSATRNFPFCYSWTPPSYGVAGDGPTVSIEDNGQLAGLTVKVYYTQLMDATSFQAPITKYRMFLEAQLGSGNEYSDADRSDQQIIYPQFAGLGSTEIDLGASGALPQINPEVAFKWGIYSTGDADFMDMVEDIFKSGLAQAALDAVPNYTQQERGLSSYDLPGCVQKKVGNGSYDRPVTEGNFLVVVATNPSGSIASDAISDTQGNSWTPVFESDLSYQVWYAQANASGANAVTVSGLPAGAGPFTILGPPTGGWGPPSSGGGSCFGSDFAAWSLVVSQAGVSGENGCTFNSAQTCSSGPCSMPTLPANAIISGIYAYADPTYTGSNGEAYFIITTPSGGHTFVGGPESYLIGTDPSVIPECSFEFFGLATLPAAPGADYTYGATCTSYGIKVVYYLSELIQFEVAGADTVDQVVKSTGSSATLATTNQAPFPAYTLNLGISIGGSGTPLPVPANWKATLPQSNYNAAQSGAVLSPLVTAIERTVRVPASLTVQQTLTDGTAFCAVAFKATTPSSFPLPLGDYIDKASFDLVRQQCRANGLYGSLAMTSQSSGSDWLKSLFAAADAAAVYLGNKLFALPYSEVSTAGNGAFYTAPTAAGPIASLVAGAGQSPNADFVDPPELAPADRIDLPNVLQLQIICRENNYNQLVITQPESATLSLYGMRKADPVVMNCVQDPLVAQMLLGIMVRRSQYGGDVYSFTLSPRWMLLSPMDLVEITDVLAGIVGVPVRLTSVAEQEDLSLACEAEPFIYGMCAPTPYTAAIPAPNPLDTNESAGDVNAPLIFEPVPQLCAEQNQAQLWLVISSSSADYGGCQVYVSTDGGSSYNAAGPPLNSNAIMGLLTAVWPAANDPDTTNNLFLDMSESGEPVQSISLQEENQFLLPCIVTGADITIENNGTAVASISLPDFENDGTLVCEPSLAFNYELMAYAVATLTSTNAYELMATGSGNELRRSVYDAPNTGGVGITHSVGETFAVLPPDGQGIFKINMPSQWVGVEVFFKILSFNSFGNALQSLSDVPAYSYTPTGVPYS